MYKRHFFFFFLYKEKLADSVFLQSDLMYFDIPQRKKLIRWTPQSKGSSDSGRSYYGMFVRANARMCD